MNHSKEINEIKDMLDGLRKKNDKSAFFKNCPTRRYDDELTEGVSFISGKSVGLPCDIIVDTGATYKYYNHPLCLFVINGDKVIPVTIQEQPLAKEGAMVPVEVISFIIDNLKILTDVANLKISGGEFYRRLREYVNSKNEVRLIGEMSNFGPEDTGLDVWVYVDDTDSYLKSGHRGSYRIKFQQDKDIWNQRKWMPITIPGLKIMKSKGIPPCKIKKSQVNNVIIWAKGNLDLLMALRDHVITGMEFEEKMLKYKDVKVLLDSKCNK